MSGPEINSKSPLILLLGGTGDAKSLAAKLIAARYPVIYSIAGLVRQPNLGCEILSGGFRDFSSDGQSGVEGLIVFIAERNIDLVIDATHPYAVEISDNASAACGVANIPCWRLDRHGWSETDKGEHQTFSGCQELIAQLTQYQRPFFTIGQSALQYVRLTSPSQHLIIRSAVTNIESDNNFTLISGIPPFPVEHEVALMQQHKVDALITKNSGGQSVVAKLHAAQHLSIPIFIQNRQILAAVDQVFDTPDAIISALVRLPEKLPNIDG